MAVSKTTAPPPRSRPASVDSRARERDLRATSANAKEQKKEEKKEKKDGVLQHNKSGSLFCGCVTGASTASPPPTGRRAANARAARSVPERKKGDVPQREESKSQTLEYSVGDNLLKGSERSTTESLGFRSSLLGSLEGKTQLQTGENGIVKKFTLLTEGFDGRPASPFRPRLSPGKVSPLVEQHQPQQNSVAPDSGGNSPTVMPQPHYTSYSKLSGSNSSGLGLGTSPPVMDRSNSRPSPTLSQMMAHEQDMHKEPLLEKGQLNSFELAAAATSTGIMSAGQGQKPSLLQEKVSGILGGTSPGNQFNDVASSDLNLTLSSKDGYNVSVSVHRHILVANSRFFAAKLSDRWSKQQRTLPHLVEISDCEDVELYLETLRLMYCCDLKRTLMKETVGRVLGILKVSAAIVFEAGVVSCLEFLEAVPWAEDEEQKVTSLLSRLQLESVGASEVLKRCAAFEQNTNSEDILVRLLNSVTRGTDEKARREMKALVSRMLRENVSQNKDQVDVSKDSLYKACHRCVDGILHIFMQATSPEFLNKNSEDRGNVYAQIARQADNLHWLVDILIDRRIADDLVRLWAHQSELATLHMQVPTMYRYEVSRLTARFCIAIGKGQVVSPKDVRYMLLQTWLQPLVEDFGWMQRCCKVLDKKVVEEGISQTILTLPLKQQQNILLAWFDRFSIAGDDCPNLQKAFEVWWRRMFLRPGSQDEDVPLLSESQTSSS